MLLPPDVAARFDVKDGDWVWLRNQFGRCKRKVVVDATMAPCIASTDHGWWFPESEGRSEKDGLFGALEYNCNMLFKFDQGKAGFGCDYKNMLVIIDKVEGE